MLVSGSPAFFFLPYCTLQNQKNSLKNKKIRKTTLLLAFSVCNSNYELQH
jgi:hypothetical protein